MVKFRRKQQECAAGGTGCQNRTPISGTKRFRCEWLCWGQETTLSTPLTHTKQRVGGSINTQVPQSPTPREQEQQKRESAHLQREIRKPAHPDMDSGRKFYKRLPMKICNLSLPSCGFGILIYQPQAPGSPSKNISVSILEQVYTHIRVSIMT